MDPVKLTIELYIDSPVSNDIDELTDLTVDAVEKAIGVSDYVVVDMGLSFELQDE
jgi:hypothetical protein